MPNIIHPHHPMRIFLYIEITRICTITIIPNFNKKDFFDILCLNTAIPSKAPTVPPKNVTDNKVNSEILRWCFTALRLSIPKRIKLKMLKSSTI